MPSWWVMAFSPLAVNDRCRAWLEASIGPCAIGPPFPRATSATVVPVDTDGRRFVLKWFTWSEFVAEDSDRARREAFGLGLASSVGVPAPSVVNLDPDGEATGHPALLMTAVSGSSLPRPDDWPARAAAVAARLHASHAAVDRQHERFVPEPFVPRWASDLGVWDEAIGVVAELAPIEEAVIHRDLHRWNMHWVDGELTGVVDWLSVCHGPIGEDVAHVWINEVLEGDAAAGAAFRDAYVEVSVRGWDARWEVQSALDMLPAYVSDEAVEAWGSPLDRSRLEDCLRFALRCL